MGFMTTVAAESCLFPFRSYSSFSLEFTDFTRAEYDKSKTHPCCTSALNSRRPTEKQSVTETQITATLSN